MSVLFPHLLQSLQSSVFWLACSLWCHLVMWPCRSRPVSSRVEENRLCEKKTQALQVFFEEPSASVLFPSNAIKPRLFSPKRSGRRFILLTTDQSSRFDSLQFLSEGLSGPAAPEQGPTGFGSGSLYRSCWRPGEPGTLKARPEGSWPGCSAGPAARFRCRLSFLRPAPGPDASGPRLAGCLCRCRSKRPAATWSGSGERCRPGPPRRWPGRRAQRCRDRCEKRDEKDVKMQPTNHK